MLNYSIEFPDFLPAAYVIEGRKFLHVLPDKIIKFSMLLD